MNNLQFNTKQTTENFSTDVHEYIYRHIFLLGNVFANNCLIYHLQQIITNTIMVQMSIKYLYLHHRCKSIQIATNQFWHNDFAYKIQFRLLKWFRPILTTEPLRSLCNFMVTLLKILFIIRSSRHLHFIDANLELFELPHEWFR